MLGITFGIAQAVVLKVAPCPTDAEADTETDDGCRSGCDTQCAQSRAGSTRGSADRNDSARTMGSPCTA